MFADENIATPIPLTPDSVFGGFNFFHSSIRFARIASVAYSTLFSISSTRNTVAEYHLSMDHVQSLLGSWLSSIPEEFRPGKLRTSYSFSSPAARLAFIGMSYRYYALVISLARLRLHLDDQDPELDPRRRVCKRVLVSTARAVIELTRYADLEPHTPVL